MNINEENEITNSLAEHTHKSAHELVDVICEENCLDDENLSVASSENASVQDTALQPKTFIVKNSSDIHIGDRTYLTIQHHIPDSEIFEKIVNDVIESSKCRNISDVENTKEQLRILDYSTTDSPASFPPQNGTISFPKNTSTNFTENHWLKGDFKFCGYAISIKLSLILILGLLALVTGCILAILYLNTDEQFTPSPSSASFLPTTPIPHPAATGLHPNGRGTDNSSQPQIPSYPRPKDWYLISRKDWNAWEPEDTIVYLHHPVKNVIIAHTAGSECLTEVDCFKQVRGIQASALASNNFDDIPYNFLVGGDGSAFEGVGWDVRGSHTRRYNSVSIGIAFMGNFVFAHPTPQQLEALKRLLTWGVEIGKLDPDYRLLPHNLTHATLSPGRFVYEEIKNWPHFTTQRFYIDP